MECNREEAIRARDIAAEKFAKQDFLGAKKFMVKAQQLYPSLEGLGQMLAVVEVHSVAQNKVGAGTEMDWYGILEVPPGADDSTVKKQYRKLALLLHPDKNKSVGAEAAFKLIGEAWAILSDKTKRTLHDMKRAVKVKAPNIRVQTEQQKSSQQFKATGPAPVPPPAPTPVPPGLARAHAAAAAAGRGIGKFSGRGHRQANPTPPSQFDAFWTCCPNCNVQYQYLRTYENYQLKCHGCQSVFKATDMGGGKGGYFNFNASQPSQGPHRPQPSQGNAANVAANGFANGGMGPFPSAYPPHNASFFSPAAAEAVAQSKAAAAAAAAATTSSPANNPSANVVHQTFYRVKRDRVQNKRKEKEEQLKYQDAGRAQEAMDRLKAKREERHARESIKRKVDGKRKLKRKKKLSDEEDAEQEERNSAAEASDILCDDISSPSMPRRRSSRTKKNVASYKVDDASEDSEMDAFQAAPKRAKAEREADDPEGQTSNGRDPSGRPAGSENGGGKGKGIADDSNNHGSRPAGDPEVKIEENSDRSETPSRRGSGTFEDAALLRKDKSTSNAGANGRKFGPFGRGYERQESEVHGVRADKTSQDFEQMGFTAKDARFDTKSPKTHRMRVKSLKVPHPSGQGLEDDLRKGQDASPASPGSSSSEKEYEADDEEVDEQIDVPDPDFHDFDACRTEKDLIAGQIWAMYDDEDGMPRFYGRISRVSTKPFKVHLTWLEYLPFSERGKRMMDSTGLSIGAGMFRLAKAAVIHQINTFSHVVEEKPTKGQVRIYPKKDQVWAVFRDWNSEKFRPLKIRKSRGGSNAYNYDMVQVLSDHVQGEGVRTMKLVKVSGYKTLFQRLRGEEAIQVYTDVERFSHSVPNAVLEDALAKTHGVPAGSLELDPAATPMDLISANAPGAV